ncbi:transporter substrate-binding domain-containing protein [Variovorax sp. PAMC26660]|uniref:transporter substrate-binding domain-containing protein n=1 Tax=Variovorax sp. PAMC26660 TaxID=2762322 RepID=UPI0021C3139B|nr:transporter substrate-binding domain-containing protein [Variovorax sp. PAMC26660]
MSITTTRRAAIAALGLGAALTVFAPFASAQSVADIKKKGEITIGMLVDFPPYGTTDAKNQPDGYDADVAKLLAKDWGVKANIVPVTGPNRIPFLLTNKVDVLVASLAITPERAKQVDFSIPYAAASVVLFGAKKVEIKTAADFKGILPRGNLKRHILNYLRSSDVPLYTDDIALHVAKLENIDFEVTSRKRLNVLIRYRLKQMAREGILERHHPQMTREMGRWSLRDFPDD